MSVVNCLKLSGASSNSSLLSRRIRARQLGAAETVLGAAIVAGFAMT